MANNNIWVVVGVALVVAVVASLATAGITGDVIKVRATNYQVSQVYTRAEVNALIAPLELQIKCAAYDFNCDSSTDTADAVIIGDLWSNGTTIDASLVSGSVSKCHNFANYLGYLWKNGIDSIPIDETSRIIKLVKDCNTATTNQYEK